ncbi:NAD-specific glutamate dehydrogenase [Pseudomonas mediterranea]
MWSFHRLDRFFVRDRFIGHASFLQNSIHNLFFEHNRTDFVQLLVILVVPGHDLLRLLISRSHFLDQLANAGFVRLEFVLLDHFRNDQAQYDTTLGLLFEQLGRQLIRLDVAAELLNSLHTQTVHFVVQQGLRHFDRVGGQQTVHDLILDLGLDGLTQLTLHVLANFGAETFQTGFLDTELGEELFVQLRQLRLGNTVDGHGELGGFAGQVQVLIVLWEGHVQNALFAGFRADQAIFEARDHATGAQHQLGGLGGTAGEHFTVDLADEIDVQLIFVLRGAIGHFETGVLLAQDVQHLVQVGIRHVSAQALDGNRFETGNGELGEHFESGNEFQVLAFFQHFRLDRWRAGRVQLLLDHGFVERRLDHVAHGLLARISFVTLTDHAHWHLAWTETWDFGLLGSLLQTLVDLSLDALSRHGDAHAALKSSSIFNRNLHGYSSLHRRWPGVFRPQNQGHAF